MGFYDEMQSVATEALGEFSQGTLKLKKHTAGAGPSHNPAVGTWSAGELLKGAVNGAANATSGGFGKTYVDGTVILASDLMVTCAVPTVEPAVGDKVEIDGVDHNVVAVKRMPEAGTAVAFKIFVRK